MEVVHMKSVAVLNSVTHMTCVAVLVVVILLLLCLFFFTCEA